MAGVVLLGEIRGYVTVREQETEWCRVQSIHKSNNTSILHFINKGDFN